MAPGASILAPFLTLAQAEPARDNMGLMPEGTAFWMYLLLVPTLLVLAYGVWARIQVYRRGKPLAGRSLRKELMERVGEFINKVLGQEKILQESKGGRNAQGGHGKRSRLPAVMHASVFFGFLALFIGTTLVAIDQDVFEALLDSKMLRGAFYLGFEITLDLLGLLFVLGVSIAIVRRTFFRPKWVEHRWNDVYMLSLLLFLGVTGYVLEGMRLALRPVPWAEWSPVGHAFAGWLTTQGWTGMATEHAYIGLWWAHLGVTYVFVASIPYTKFSHIFSSPANIVTRDLRPRGQMTKPFDLAKALETGEFDVSFGPTKASEFAWQDLLMADSCTNCGRCEAVCPATAAGRALSPRVLMQALARESMLEAKRDKTLPGWYPVHGYKVAGPGATRPSDQLSDGNFRLVGEGVLEETLWACVTCRACEEECPVSIQHVDLITDMRRTLVNESRVSKKHVAAFEGITNAGNPWAMAHADRMDWAQGLGVPTMEAAAATGPVEALYWVGCAGAYDPRNQKVSRAIVRVLQAANVNFAVLGTEERCNGETARRMGDEGRYQQQVLANLETFARYKGRFTKIVTGCPHCFNTLANEYPQFGDALAGVEVLHHAVYFERLVKEGRLKPEHTAFDSISYHDSCYNGRYNDIYSEPRDLLAATGAKVCEVDGWCKEKGRCCGAGGGNMWFEVPEKRRISHIRLEELSKAGGEAVAVNCPYCMIMFEDAEGQLATGKPIQDIAEVMVKALGLPEDRRERTKEDAGGAGGAGGTLTPGL